jgi:glycosyltransferase involved in cell wall biosynthesis
MKSNSLVSIVIPLYNQGIYIDETLESVEKQSYPNMEVIIVNDGSNDEYTLEKIKQLLRDGYKVIDKVNGGLASARNYGITQAKGKYIVALDSDDIIHPDYISKCVEKIEKTDYRIVYTRALLFGHKHGMWMLPKFTMKKMLQGNIIYCSAMFYREDWVKVGGYDEKLRSGLEDWDFWLSILASSKENTNIVFRLNKPMFYYRIRNNSMLRKIDLDKKKKIVEYIYEKHKQLFELYSVTPTANLKNHFHVRLLNKFLSIIYGLFYHVR